MNSVISVLKSKTRALRALLGLSFITILAAGCLTIPQLVNGNPSPLPTGTAAIPLTAATQQSLPTSLPATATQAPSATAVPPTATEVPSPTAIPPTATQPPLPTAVPSPTPPPTVVAIPVNPQSNPPGMPAPVTGSQQVSIANLSFNPAALTIPVGTQITWTNHDMVAHTVTADNGAFNSGILNPGASFRFQFNQPGTFPYHCQIHPMMTGTITVTNAMAMATMPAMPAVPPSSSVPTVVAIPVNPASNGTSNNGALTVTIQNFAFSPQTLTIMAGTRVQWINNDATAHTVTANSGTFDSNILQPGSSFAVTFSQPGTYAYHCKIHPNMTGTIIVTGMSHTVPSVPPSGGGGASPSYPAYPMYP